MGPKIKSYQKNKGVTRKGKIGIIIFMISMVLFSSFVVIQNHVIRLVILLLGVIGLIVVWFFVPTGQPLTNEENENAENTDNENLPS